ILRQSEHELDALVADLRRARIRTPIEVLARRLPVLRDLRLHPVGADRRGGQDGAGRDLVDELDRERERADRDLRGRRSLRRELAAARVSLRRILVVAAVERGRAPDLLVFRRSDRLRAAADLLLRLLLDLLFPLIDLGLPIETDRLLLDAEVAV